MASFASLRALAPAPRATRAPRASRASRGGRRLVHVSGTANTTSANAVTSARPEGDAAGRRAVLGSSLASAALGALLGGSLAAPAPADAFGYERASIDPAKTHRTIHPEHLRHGFLSRDVRATRRASGRLADED